MARKSTQTACKASLTNLVSDVEIRGILAAAKVAGDHYTVASATRALAGDLADRLACAMVLGR